MVIAIALDWGVMMSKNNKDFSRALKRMGSNAQSMNGTSNVDFNDLFSTEFMKKYTNKTDIYEFIEASNLDVHSQEDFNAVMQTNDWNHYVKRNTRFNSWHEMYEKALGEYTFNNLFKGL